MARKITETPVLTGKNARRFERILEESKNKKVSKEEKQRAIEVYRRIMSASSLG